MKTNILRALARGYCTKENENKAIPIINEKPEQMIGRGIL